MTFRKLRQLAAFLILAFGCSLFVYADEGETGEESLFSVKRKQERLKEQVRELKEEVRMLEGVVGDLKRLRADLDKVQFQSKQGKIDSLKSRFSDNAIQSASRVSILNLLVDYLETLNSGGEGFQNVMWGLIQKTGLMASSYDQTGATAIFRQLNEEIDDDRAKVRAERLGIFKQLSISNAKIESFQQGQEIDFDLAKVKTELIAQKGLLLSHLEQYLGETEFSKLQSSLKGAFDGAIEEQETAMSEKNASIEELEEKEEEIFNQVQSKEEGQFKIDRILVWTLPLYGLLMVLMLLIPKFYPGQSIREAIFGSGLILQLITVYLLTVTILILGIAGKISSEVLGTLIGGISGYVLGRNMPGRKGKDKEE